MIWWDAGSQRQCHHPQPSPDTTHTQGHSYSLHSHNCCRIHRWTHWPANNSTRHTVLTVQRPALDGNHGNSVESMAILWGPMEMEANVEFPQVSKQTSQNFYEWEYVWDFCWNCSCIWLLWCTSSNKQHSLLSNAETWVPALITMASAQCKLKHPLFKLWNSLITFLSS